MNIVKNVGKLDRNIRLAVGLLLILWGVVTQNWLGIVGLVLVVTAAINFCPAYSLLKIDTSKGGK